jgi:phospholipid/cholesterol/gamma-HCH transport system permease protein
MLFFLTIISDFFGILGGAGVTIFMNGQNGTQYFSQAYESLHARDVMQGLIKPLFSGFIIATIGCFYGLRTSGGTQGVGRSTIQAVVSASVLIIFVDLLVSQVMIALLNR